MSLIQVQIPKWEKFNPRSDRANYSWFRMQNTFFLDQQIFGLTDSQKVMFLFLLCERSKKNQPDLELQIDYISAILKQSESEIIKNINGLSLRRLIDVIKTDDDRLSASLGPATIRNDTIRNDTEEVSPELNLEALSYGVLTEFTDDPTVMKILTERKVKISAQQAWIKAFPDPHWIKQTILKANVWESANPQRRKKKYGAFISNWLMRDWDKRKVSALHESKPLKAAGEIKDPYAFE